MSKNSLLGKMSQQSVQGENIRPSRVQCLPANIVSPFLPAAPLQYVPRIRFTQATIDCLATDKTTNALHNETVILNCIGAVSYTHLTLPTTPYV